MKLQRLLMATLMGGVMMIPVWAATTDTNPAGNGSIMITADQLTYDGISGRAEAKGSVVITKDDKTMKEFDEKIRDSFAYLDYAKIVYVSAKTKQRVFNIFPLIKESYENRQRRIQSSTLNEIVVDAVSMNPTPQDKGKRLNIFYASQVAINPPTFVFFVNYPELMHFSYERFLENRIRDSFNFEGTPIKLLARQRN